MTAFALALHILGAVVWVGGMFAAYLLTVMNFSHVMTAVPVTPTSAPEVVVASLVSVRKPKRPKSSVAK